MRHKWRSLCFYHRPVPPEIVQKLLPAGLKVQTFPDDTGQPQAWIGFVPFRMQNIRFAGFPSVPGTDRFPESNLRTYVESADGAPGVWFFTLDVNHAIAIQLARRRYGLNYLRADIEFHDDGNHWKFSGHRRGSSASYRAEILLADSETRVAEPGSFEFWVAERYRLFSVKKGRLFTGRVYHAPYRCIPAASYSVTESYSQAVGLPPGDYVHAMASPGANVEVFPLEPIS